MIEATIPERWLRPLSRLIPIPALHKLIAQGDSIHRKAREILAQKRRALELGDEAVKTQVGEGKDIMSVLRKSASRRPEPVLTLCGA